MGSHKKKKKNKTGRRSTAGPPKQRFSIKWVVLIVAVIAGAAGLIGYNLRPTESDQMPLAAAGQSKSGPTVEFDKLIGRWLRPDGGYVIEIRNISSGGRMEASYFNPRLINVSRAEVFRKKGGLEIFVELRDTGYPGSTYTLSYNPEQDMLTGIYFQATMGQSFEVIFVRAK
ncbi:MAG: hypothetical protein WBM69_04365 [Desulfobacterales bacterium]